MVKKIIEGGEVFINNFNTGNSRIDRKVKRENEILRKIVDYLTLVGMAPRFLPPYSPQLNPIEEYFNCIKAAFKGFRPIPQSHEELNAALHTILTQTSFETSGFLVIPGDILIKP